MAHTKIVRRNAGLMSECFDIVTIDGGYTVRSDIDSYRLAREIQSLIEASWNRPEAA